MNASKTPEVRWPDRVDFKAPDIGTSSEVCKPGAARCKGTDQASGDEPHASSTTSARKGISSRSNSSSSPGRGRRHSGKRDPNFGILPFPVPQRSSAVPEIPFDDELLSLAQGGTDVRSLLIISSSAKSRRTPVLDWLLHRYDQVTPVGDGDHRGAPTIPTSAPSSASGKVAASVKSPAVKVTFLSFDFRRGQLAGQLDVTEVDIKTSVVGQHLSETTQAASVVNDIVAPVMVDAIQNYGPRFDGCLLFFDAYDRMSLDVLKSLRSSVLETLLFPTLAMLIGRVMPKAQQGALLQTSTVDAPTRRGGVGTAEASALADTWGVPYLEAPTTAAEKVVVCIVDTILDQIAKERAAAHGGASAATESSEPFKHRRTPSEDHSMRGVGRQSYQPSDVESVGSMPDPRVPSPTAAPHDVGPMEIGDGHGSSTSGTPVSVAGSSRQAPGKDCVVS